MCYAGVATSATHAKWLSIVIYRAAASHVVTPGRQCYIKDVAGDVQTRVGAMLAGLQARAVMEDVVAAAIMPDSV